MAWQAVTFDQNGGTGGETRILFANYKWSNPYSAIKYWSLVADSSVQYLVSSVTVPTKPGYAFAGYKASSDIVYARADGSLVFPQAFWGAPPSTASAVWRDYSAVNLDLAGGSGTTPATIYRRISDGACFSDAALTTPITSVPVPTKLELAFAGFVYNGILAIDASGNITDAFAALEVSSAEITATASWTDQFPSFGEVVDYFGLGSATLIPFESDDGANRPRVVTAHYGRHTANVRTSASESLAKITADEEASVVWRNPTVRYMVVGDMTLALQLGKAYAATDGRTGYMILSALVETAVRKFPVVTVSAVANEGAEEIKKFLVSIPIQARARAQNLLGAISGGGDLQQLSLLATADPVVLEENMVPCASDVVNGRLEVHAETLAPNAGDAPDCPAAGGFALVGKPKHCEGTNYRRWSVAARKEIV